MRIFLPEEILIMARLNTKENELAGVAFTSFLTVISQSFFPFIKCHDCSCSSKREFHQSYPEIMNQNALKK